MTVTVTVTDEDGTALMTWQVPRVTANSGPGDTTVLTLHHERRPAQHEPVIVGTGIPTPPPTCTESGMHGYAIGRQWILTSADECPRCHPDKSWRWCV